MTDIGFARLDSCTCAQCRKHIDENVMIYCPKVAAFLHALLAASPSEACVERLFSLLGRMLAKLKNQTDSKTVVAKLRIAAGYAFFHRSAFADMGSDGTTLTPHYRNPSAPRRTRGDAQPRSSRSKWRSTRFATVRCSKSSSGARQGNSSPCTNGD